MFDWDRSALAPDAPTPLCIATARDLAIVAVPNGVFRSTDGGARWEPCALDGILGNWPRAAWASDDGLVCVVGDGAYTQRGIVMISDDAGRSFRTIDAGTKAPLQNVVGHGDVLWAVGHLGAALRSADRGRTWSYSQPGGTGILSGLCRDDAGRLWASGTGGLVLVSEDGHAWTTARRKGAQFLYGVARTSAGLLVAAGCRGSVFTSEDGAQWTARRTKTKAYFYAGATVTGDTAWVAGQEERSPTALWSDDGRAWHPVALGDDAGSMVHAIHGVSADEVWIASDRFVHRGRRRRAATP
ncbi:MAG: hypothetical protein KC636_07225 [Myxococcales bacterium]|nr:hypothetical protein [Myxococcales bacterium]